MEVVKPCCNILRAITGAKMSILKVNLNLGSQKFFLLRNGLIANHIHGMHKKLVNKEQGRDRGP